MAACITTTLLALFSVSVLAIPEQGKWIFNLSEKNQFAAVSKHMYNRSKVIVSVSLTCDESKDVQVRWWLLMLSCTVEFTELTKNINTAETSKLDVEGTITHIQSSLPYEQVEFLRNRSIHHCLEHTFQIEGDANQMLLAFKNFTKSSSTSQQIPALHSNSSSALESKQSQNEDDSASNMQAPSGKSKAASPGKTNLSRKKRDGSAKNAPITITPATKQLHKPNKLDHRPLAETWVDGNYLFIIQIQNTSDKTFKAEVKISTVYGDDNYISAMDYPLLIFYGVMGLIYIGYGLVWLVLLACNWRDLLRVQFWIGGVILLGMLEKAVFFAEYENINKTGQSVRGAVIFAELVSCLKRTLARMLVIIVSLGFGIVKPRLGQTFHRVMFVGGLYFILASIEGCVRTVALKAEQSNQFLLTAVPLAVLEAIICWWIFSSLIQTTRTLRLRRNVVKLTLYRHFTNTLIFAVLASIACMVWSMTQHKFKECIEDWKQLWIDEAFWHMLFVILLFIIMLLWRPTANNQRYAFSPLLDAADEEDDEDAMMNDAFDGMKMRGVKPSNGSPKTHDPKSKMEDDLKWVEENIPSSIADKALPTLLDSDEELMTTKFEMSKME